MYRKNNSTSNADDKTDNWSFSFEYQHFSSKNKPKSLLGRRNQNKVSAPPKENINSDLKLSSNNESSSLTYPVNPYTSPVHNFAIPSSSAIRHSALKSNEKFSKRGIGFSTPFCKDECHPDKENNGSTRKVSAQKEVSKNLSSVFVKSNKDLNASFTGEEAFPLPGENSFLSEANQPIKTKIFDKTSELSQTENGNNSCFMTANDMHPIDFNSSKLNDFIFKTPIRDNDYLNSKTPGRNFTLFSISQSPIDPLNGILNEDNESYNSSNSVNPSPQVGSNKSKSVVDSFFLTETELNKIHERNKEQLGKSQNESLKKVELQVESNNISHTPKVVVKGVCLSKSGNVAAPPEQNIKSEPSCRPSAQPVESSVKNEVQEVKPLLKTLSNHKVESSSNDTSDSIQNIKEPPTVVIRPALQSNELVKISQPCPPTRVDEGFNPKLLVKPLPQNILYVNNKAYVVLSLLGRGGSSEVFQALEENSSRLLAIKCVNLATADESTANGYLNEIELLSKLQGCPSVIKMFDHEYVESLRRLYVVMEKGDIDLSKLMKDINKTKKLPFSMILYFWTEMLSAVKEIHDKGVIHADLKPANFLLVCGRLKLIDFGIASSLQGDMTSVERDVVRGTFNYISPEAICVRENLYLKINYKSDVWSLGCILYNLIFGCTPFSHIASTVGKIHAIADPNYKIKFPKEYNSIHQVLKMSLRWCLVKDPKSRPTVDRLLKLSEFTFQGSCKDIMQEFPDYCVTFDDNEY